MRRLQALNMQAKFLIATRLTCKNKRLNLARIERTTLRILRVQALESHALPLCQRFMAVEVQSTSNITTKVLTGFKPTYRTILAAGIDRVHHSGGLGMVRLNVTASLRNHYLDLNCAPTASLRASLWVYDTYASNIGRDSDVESPLHAKRSSV